MIVYRCYSEGSWTARNFAIGDESKAIAMNNSNIKMLEGFDRYFNGLYHDIFSDAIDLKRMKTSISKRNKER